MGRSLTVAVFGLLLAGCATWLPTPPSAAPGIEETDETFKAPVRPEQKDEQLPWYDLRNILDPRSRDIERRLGA
jgi:hypothetical protein